MKEMELLAEVSNVLRALYRSNTIQFHFLLGIQTRLIIHAISQYVDIHY
jgi:hypothetical protein